jgi:hypothetical protein
VQKEKKKFFLTALREFATSFVAHLATTEERLSDLFVPTDGTDVKPCTQTFVLLQIVDFPLHNLDPTDYLVSMLYNFYLLPEHLFVACHLANPSISG